MIDEIERLAENDALQRLLVHYAEAAGADREVWQNRLMQLDGVEPRELVKLHGELLAFGWIDQNTGATPVLKPGVICCIYRITAVGLRALRQVQSAAATGEEDLNECPAEDTVNQTALLSEPTRADAA